MSIMNNADTPAMPNTKHGTTGLTKREHFAYGAMVALITHYGINSESLPGRAFAVAEVMLKELEDE